MPPTPDNSEGYFEDLDFVQLHMRSLRANGYADNGILAGGRIVVPKLLTAEAVSLADARVHSHGPWGWKDPRTVLFLDFWKDLLPDATHVFVFRSPWEVVDSLFRRGTDEAICTNPPLALACWVHYNSLIRDFLVRHRTTCVLLEASDIAARPWTVVAAIQEHLGIALAEPESLSREGMLTSLAGSPREAFIRECAPTAAALYEELRALAGESSSQRNTKPRQVTKPNDVTFEMGMGDWYSLYDQNRQVAHWRNATATAEATVASLQHQITEIQQLVVSRDNVVDELRDYTNTLESEKASLADAVNTLNVRIGIQQAELDTSTSRLEAQTLALHTFEAGNIRLNEAVSLLQAEVATRESHCSEQARAIAALDQEVAASTAQIEGLVALAEKLDAATKMWQQRYEQERQSSTALQRQIDSLTIATSEAEREIADTQCRMASLEQSLAGVEYDRTAALNRVEELESLAAEQGRNITGLATSLDRTSHNLHTILESKSWALTSPLRELRRWCTHPRQRLKHYLTATRPRRQHADSPPADATAAKCVITEVVTGGPTNGQYNTLVGPATDAGTEALMSIPEQLANPTPRSIEDACRLIAFYLPQYHRIPENDEWWGPGFTEWTNVARGRPNFDGHHQPQIPRELGFYDLSSPDVIRRQAEMARLYGISGFCFYHYWFSGRRVLERPLELFMQSDIDMSFCICWANENWTRTWDGDTKTVLLEQKYALGDDELFFNSIVDVLRDRRYIRVEGKPLLVVYRAKHIPNPQQTFATWRRMACEAGLGGLHISVVDFYDISNPAEVDADSLLEFPPHKFNGPANIPNTVPPITNPSFSGGILDYRKMIAQSLHKVAPAFTYFRGIVPNWDNTARRQDTPTTIIHSTPEWYGRWLTYLRAYTRRHAKRPDHALVFVNAWNEWGEGCHLEPDVKWGLQYLESTFRTRFIDPAASLETTTARLHADLSHVLGDQPQSRAIPNAPAHVENGVVAAKATNGVYYRPVDERIHRIAAALRKYPLAYGVARYTYRTYYRLWG